MSINVKTREHGRFYAGPNGLRRFAGSGSGVYLADVIRQRLSGQLERETGIMDAFISSLEGVTAPVGTLPDFRPYLLTGGELRNEGELQQRFARYFSDVHPLFPFLDGAQVREAFKGCLQYAQHPDASVCAFETVSGDALVTTVMLRSIFAIGKRSDETSPFTDTAFPTRLAQQVLAAYQSSQIGPLPAIQALFSIVLAFFFSRRFRPAAHWLALITRLVHEAGLHRCPSRYPTIFVTPAERSLRKRLFFAVYIVDRFLARQLGVPLLLRDVDIDVCLPGADEIHGEDEARQNKRKRDTSQPASPNPVHPSNPTRAVDTPSAYTEGKMSGSNRILPVYYLSRLAGIMGRILETFNGSRRWREADPDQAARIRADLDEWWLDYELDMQDQTMEQRNKHLVLFRCLYNQQIMHQHRHSLSLSVSSDAHRTALQAMILASRTISASLSSETESLFWPGYTDMLFDASMIMMYGLQHSAKLTQDRALHSLRQIVQCLDRSFTDVTPVLLLVRGFCRQLDPRSADSPLDPALDWLIGTSFNLEANPIGPDFLHTPANYLGDSLSTADLLRAFTRDGI